MPLFPDDMLNISPELTMESVDGQLSFFYDQVHLYHLQTPSYAEHMALNVWQEIVDLKDDVMEALQGCEGRKVRTFKSPPIIDYSPGAPARLMNDIKEFSRKLEDYAGKNRNGAVENLAQDLHHMAVKTLFLLTLS